LLLSQETNSTQTVKARMDRYELTGSGSTIADLNRGPKNQIVTDKIRSLSMAFGGDELLQRTVADLVRSQ
jgi:hypothetical protein